MDGMLKTEIYLKKSGLDPKMLELIKTRVSQINGCAFCLDMHYKDAIHLGESELRLSTLAGWRECPYYSEKEKTVLALAEALTLHPHVEDSLFETLSRLFSRAEIADLVLAISQINSWNRLNIAFRSTPGNYQVGQFG
jgi:AhpD family alkylhydroperoxidase